MKTSTKVRIALVATVGTLLLAWSWQASRPPVIEPGSTLVLELSGAYPEGPGPSIFAQLLGGARPSFASLRSSFAKAERDDRIATVVVHVRGLDVGWAKAQEIRGAIGRLRGAGRRTVAHLEAASFSPNLDYYVASAADEVRVPPGSSLPMFGLAAEHLYLGGLWKKLGVDVEVARVGKYKSAAESVASERMSEAAREMADSLLDATYAQFVGGIAQGRGMEPDAVRAVIDTGALRAEDLIAAGLLDGVTHLADLTDELDAPVVEADTWATVPAEAVGFEAEAEMALVYASGTVVSGEGRYSRTGEPVFASRTVSEALIDAAEDPRFAAIILRIDSPGGSALASEEVFAALARARRHKPVVASLSDVAASGGYYVAAGADAVVASPLCLTGSIGVFALRPVVGGLLERVGVNVESLTRGEHADFYLSSRPLSPGASARLQSLVEETYALFIARVAEGRAMDALSVEAVAQGRVWTGTQALEAGLVDELGGLHEAVDRAKALAGIDASADVALVPFPQAPSLADQLGGLLRGEIAAVVAREMGPLAALADAKLPAARTLRELEQSIRAVPIGQPLALAPLWVEVR